MSRQPVSSAERPKLGEFKHDMHLMFTGYVVAASSSAQPHMHINCYWFPLNLIIALEGKPSQHALKSTHLEQKCAWQTHVLLFELFRHH